MKAILKRDLDYFYSWRIFPIILLFCVSTIFCIKSFSISNYDKTIYLFSSFTVNAYGVFPFMIIFFHKLCSLDNMGVVLRVKRIDNLFIEKVIMCFIVALNFGIIANIFAFIGNNDKENFIVIPNFEQHIFNNTLLYAIVATIYYIMGIFMIGVVIVFVDYFFNKITMIIFYSFIIYFNLGISSGMYTSKLSKYILIGRWTGISCDANHYLESMLIEVALIVALIVITRYNAIRCNLLKMQR